MRNTTKSSGNEDGPDEIFKRLRQHYSGLGLTTALGAIAVHDDPFRVLISTVLSQRTRDAVTEDASKRLFRRYPDAKALCSAPLKDIKQAIRAVCFYRNKAIAIKQIAKTIDRDYGGRVPDKVEELMLLPSVGRKTANCTLVYGFGKSAIPVDTHVHRISNRLGLVKTDEPEETEKDLMRLLPRKLWIDTNELMVIHGQHICKPLRPDCEVCPVMDMCAYAMRQEAKTLRGGGKSRTQRTLIRSAIITRFPERG
ncbi:MAG: endonuclease III [Thermoplasmata archaeon]|nr:endonuclease III [Candidatus Sysuiplasma acidicola]